MLKRLSTHTSACLQEDSKPFDMYKKRLSRIKTVMHYINSHLLESRLKVDTEFIVVPNSTATFRILLLHNYWD